MFQKDWTKSYILTADLKSILNFQIQLFIKKLYEFFMELIDNLNFSRSFIDCLYFKHRLENLKNEFCITKILCHLFFCSRSPILSSPHRLCSRWFVKDSDDFVSPVKHFCYVLGNKFNNKDIESLFTNERKMLFKVDQLYFSKTHSDLVNSTQKRWMNILIVTSPSDFVIVLSEVYVRILLNISYSIFNAKWV